MALHDQVLEDVIHHGLEHCRAVGETQEHYEWFVEAMIGMKGCLPLVTFLESNIVEAPTYIWLGEVFSSLKLGNELQNNW
jgi:hypothetical protein